MTRSQPTGIRTVKDHERIYEITQLRRRGLAAMTWTLLTAVISRILYAFSQSIKVMTNE